MARRLFDRPTGEILIVLVGTTVCGYVIVNTIIILALAFFTDRKLEGAGQQITDIINTLIGLLAGYLAGRTDVALRNGQSQPDKEEP